MVDLMVDLMVETVQMRRNFCFALLFSLALAGCGSLGSIGPERDVHDEVTVAVPDTWTALDEQVNDSTELPVVEWSSLLGTDRAEEIVEETLRGSHGLAVALARVEQAFGRARIAGADIYPQVSTSLDAAERKQNFVGFPIPGNDDGSVFSSTTTTYGLSLNISWEVDLWGRLRARRDAAGHEFAASVADYRSAMLSMSGQSLKSWLALVEATEQLTLANATLENRDAILQRIERRYGEGVVGAIDVRLARANRAAARARVAGWELRRDGSARQLEILLGRYPAAAVVASAALPHTLGEIAPGEPVEVLSRRPDLRAAEHRLLAADDNVYAARASLYPQVRLNGSAGTLTDDPSNILDSDYSIWSIAAGLLQPLFQGGRLRANVDLNEAFRNEAEARFAEMFLRAAFEVEQSIFAERTLARQEQALEEAVENARGAEEASRERYLAGLVDYLIVLESQRQALESASQLLDVRRRRLESRVDLGLALGGPVAVDQLGPNYQEELGENPGENNE